ncbi:MAG: hypothetical protein OEZ10_08050 [Gammaproteobacteria bacterium]|nr:hypothetical protein [Gammaproteobacteria bacterium]
MKLKVTIEGRSKTLDIPSRYVDEAGEFFDKMDSDMDRGWQIGPEFIESPDTIQRCQIAADKMLAAIESQNENLMYLMAGYILNRMPNVVEVDIDVNGDPLGTQIKTADSTSGHHLH